MSDWINLLPNTIREKYELYNFNHAVEILAQAYRDEYKDIISALEMFSISLDDIRHGGGNESEIPRKFSNFLYPREWKQVRITGDLLVKLHQRKPHSVTEYTIRDFIDSHNIDYVKNEVAIDMEWNSKDQTFDRDLYAFRAFYECGIIACGAIITRSESLNPVFADLGIRQKYGASTTWMGKLLPKINAHRHGGCPLLVIGITPSSIIDL